MIILIVVISLSILILVHEAGHFFAAKFFRVKVHEFGLGFPPKILSKRIGETVYTLNLLPFGGFVKIHGEDDEAGETGPDSFGGQPVWKRSAIVLAGVLMNVVLGWLALSMVFAIGSPEHLAIADVTSGSPAEIAKLKSGDVILEAKFGENLLKDPIPIADFVRMTKESVPNPMDLKVQRGKEIIDISVSGRVNPPVGRGALGISLLEIGLAPQPFFQSFVKGFTATIETIKLIVIGFWNFFSKLFVTPKVIETITGPIGIFKLAGEAGSLGIVYLIQLMALISLNLAVLNLIPFPALDGGRFLFLLIEKIKGSPIPRRFQNFMNIAGFAALILLMILVTIQDVGKLIK